MQNLITEKKIKEITQKIVKEFKPEKIILFGSYAWGEPSEDSDVDLLIVMNTGKQSRAFLQRRIRSFLFPAGMPLDVLVYGREELEEKVNKGRNLFLEDIICHGRILYNASGSIEFRLSHTPAELMVA